MSAAVQFYGADNAVKAFEYKKIPSWALFQGRTMLHKHEDNNLENAAAALSEFLEMLGEASTAVYTLKVYEKDTKIKDNTPCDGSFNFRLIEEADRINRQNIYATGSKEVLQRLEAIENKLSGTDETDDDDEDDKTIGGVMLGLLKEPEKIQQLIEVAKNLGNLLQPSKAIPVIPLQKVSGIPDDKLNAAIETLKKNDPNITEHLCKLAEMSETNKPTFEYLLQMLDKI